VVLGAAFEVTLQNVPRQFFPAAAAAAEDDEAGDAEAGDEPAAAQGQLTERFLRRAHRLVLRSAPPSVAMALDCLPAGCVQGALTEVVNKFKAIATKVADSDATQRRIFEARTAAARSVAAATEAEMPEEDVMPEDGDASPAAGAGAAGPRRVPAAEVPAPVPAVASLTVHAGAARRPAPLTVPVGDYVAAPTVAGTHVVAVLFSSNVGPVGAHNFLRRPPGGLLRGGAECRRPAGRAPPP
jgi:hypothetical protein